MSTLNGHTSERGNAGPNARRYPADSRVSGGSDSLSIPALPDPVTRTEVATGSRHCRPRGTPGNLVRASWTAPELALSQGRIGQRLGSRHTSRHQACRASELSVAWHHDRVRNAARFLYNKCRCQGMDVRCNGKPRLDCLSAPRATFSSHPCDFRTASLSTQPRTS